MQRQAQLSKKQARESVHAPLDFMKVEVLGATVQAMTLEDMHGVIAYAIDREQKWLIGHHNLHSLYLFNKEINDRAPSKLQRFYKLATLTNIDGMSMVLLGRLRGYPISRIHRFTYSNTLRSQLELAQLRGWRVFYLGSSELIAERAAAIVKAEFPGLIFRNRHGFFAKERDGAENQKVLSEIAAFGPNILYVGLGMPSQEYWIEENYDALKANVILSSGATLDYIAGSLAPPPGWVSDCGLQWLHRLLSEPRRLGFRYLAEPWLTVLYATQNSIRNRWNIKY